MNLIGELFKIRPRRLAMSQLAKLAIAMKLGGQVGENLN